MKQQLLCIKGLIDRIYFRTSCPFEAFGLYSF